MKKSLFLFHSHHQRQAPKIIQATEDLYSWLPLGTLIDNKVLVVHGGVSSTTDLKAIANVDRHQFATVLQPPGQHSNYTYREWRQVCGAVCKHNLISEPAYLWRFYMYLSYSKQKMSTELNHLIDTHTYTGHWCLHLKQPIPAAIHDIGTTSKMQHTKYYHMKAREGAR